MKSSLSNFNSGWYGIGIELNDQDIDDLIRFLTMLKNDSNFHFHLFSTAFDSETSGIADIEFSRQSDNTSNMEIGA